MRKHYRMSEEDFQALLSACKPTPAMYISGGVPMFGTPQENANEAWRCLGDKMGFDGATVRPDGSDQRCFTAEERPQ